MFPPRRCLLPLVLFVAIFAAPSSPASIRMVKDLTISNESANADVVGAAGGLVYFVTGDLSGYSRDLWSTDGTSEGTRKIGPVIPPQSMDARSLYLTDVGGTAYFVNAQSGHPEIWRTDGTTAARVAASSALSITELTDIGGTLFFASAPDDTFTFDLWKSDGTEAGTQRIADIDFGGPMYDVGGVAWFKARDAGGWEAWRSDGTEAGTYRVADIYPGPSSSHASGYFDIGGLTCFSASDGVTGYELWASDGTEAGTHLALDIDGTSASSVSIPMEWNEKLYFSAFSSGSWHLYQSDCTEAGTIPIDTISAATTPFAANGFLLYADAASGAGEELWKTDGTPGGATFVRDIRPGTVSSGLGGFVNFGGLTYFSANDGVTGQELWRTDGTGAGTVRFADILPGAFPSSPGPLRVAGSNLVFEANESNDEREMWTTDGTSAGTTILADLTSGPSESSHPTGLVAFGDNVAFKANISDSGDPFWLSDGTTAGTAPIATNVDVSEYAGWNGRLVFNGDPFVSPGLWVREANGTIVELDNEATAHLSPIGDSVFYAKDGAYVTKGVPGDTLQLAPFESTWSCLHGICTGNGQAVFGFRDLGTTVLFAVRGLSDSDADELWRTDGTVAGTSKVVDVAFEGATYQLDAVVLDGKMLFPAFDVSGGTELWSTDGTPAGTARLADIEPGPTGSGPSGFVVAGNRVFFLAATTANGRELWSTDGTTMGTVPAGDIAAGSASSYIEYLTALGNDVIFAAQDATTGREVWKSDGTSTGTVRLADIYPGPGHSHPTSLEAVGSRVYFRADDPVNGGELWSTNGTPSGTTLVSDIRPGAGSSWPDELTLSGAHLFFSALTTDHGIELWALDVPVHCGNGQVDSGETCDDGNVELDDGCNDECILDSCGDGALDAGEQCDDGARIDGDGCSRACTIDCPAVPESGCRSVLEPEASRFAMKRNEDPAKSQLSWSWERGELTTKEDFGNPLASTNFLFCVYGDESLISEANAAGGVTCAGRPCWAEQTSGFAFRRKSSNGSMQIKLKGSEEAQRAQIGVKIRGMEAFVPEPLTVANPVHVRMYNELGCWGADYAWPFAKLTEKVLKAESD